MTPDQKYSTPNALKQRDPDLFEEIQEFRARLEEILLDTLDNVLDNSAFRDRGNFLPNDDLKAIACVMRVLTRDSWNDEYLDQIDAFWREAMRSDFFAEAFESSRFRVKNAVKAARNEMADKHDIGGVSQGTFW